MSMTTLNQLGVIPALLVVLPGLIILRGQDTEMSARRLLSYLLGMGVLILLALFLTRQFLTEPYARPFFQLANLLAPALLGITALILLNGKALANMGGKARIAAVAAGLAMVILLGLLWNSQLGVGYLILPGMLILGVGWALGKRSGWLVIVLSLLSLGLFYWFNQLLNHPPDYSDYSPSLLMGLLTLSALYVIPGLAVVMSALLITTGLKPVSIQVDERSLGSVKSTRWIKLAFAILLLLYLSYSIFWGSVWDQTSDGLSGIFLMQSSALVATGAGMIMILSLRGKNLLAGLLFILIAPTMLYQSFEAGWRVSYHEMTEGRAARVAHALDRYQKREGRYPAALEDLRPRDLLFIQQPVILAGEQWCYESGADYYRLSAFYREFFSAPVSLRVYASSGEFPPGSSACDERLAEMKEKYYSPMEDPAALRPPLPTPLPENEVGIQKVELQPLLDGAVTIPGSWSPDSSYFVFGTQANGLILHFLNGDTGEVCTSDAQFGKVDSIRGRFAWLPDGRILYLDASGRIAALTPCEPGGEELEGHYPVSFTQIAATEPQGNRILLQSESAYWILDAQTLTAQAIPDVTPVPYELHWDNSAWLPGGDVLVIARLNGRKGSNAGSTLYMVDGKTGNVVQSLFMEGEFGQSAPWIEILSDHELLVNGMGEWLIMDFSKSPPLTTNVLADLMGLDIKYPDEISAAGSFVDQENDSYYLAVRLNHPRNQATYLYDSRSGQVHVYNHEHHTLLVFPGGYLMEMAKLETVPTYRDEYDVVLVDQPDVAQPRLRLEGHTPREYPHLNLVYLEKRSQLAVASAQGVSLISLPGGEMLAYWELIGEGFSPWLAVAPDGSALIAAMGFGGLYFIPLPSDK